MSSITSTSEVSELLDGFDAALKDLGTMRKQFAKLLGSKKRRSGPKDPDAEPGESRSAWQEWAKTCAGRFAKDYAAHLEEVGKKADVMTFAAKCRSKTHIEEWTEHEAEWLEAHPKPEAKKAEPKKKAVKGKGKGGAKAAIVASEDEAALVASSDEESVKKPKKASKKVEEASSADEGASKKPTAKKAESADEGSTSSKKSKKKAPVADEALPKASPAPEAKKRLTKAEKEAAAAAATAASEAAAKANPPTPFKYRGKDYLKNDLNQVWQVGAEDTVGAWHGLLSEDGKKMEKSDGPV
jgi:hypothetical protein